MAGDFVWIFVGAFFICVIFMGDIAAFFLRMHLRHKSKARAARMAK